MLYNLVQTSEEYVMNYSLLHFPLVNGTDAKNKQTILQIPTGAPNEQVLKSARKTLL